MTKNIVPPSPTTSKVPSVVAPGNANAGSQTGTIVRGPDGSITHTQVNKLQNGTAILTTTTTKPNVSTVTVVYTIFTDGSYTIVTTITSMSGTVSVSVSEYDAQGQLVSQYNLESPEVNDDVDFSGDGDGQTGKPVEGGVVDPSIPEEPPGDPGDDENNPPANNPNPPDDPPDTDNTPPPPPSDTGSDDTPPPPPPDPGDDGDGDGGDSGGGGGGEDFGGVRAPESPEGSSDTGGVTPAPANPSNNDPGGRPI